MDIDYDDVFDQFFEDGVNYFGLDEVNWYGKPNNTAINDFLKRKYDILIDLSQTDLFQIHYQEE